MRTTGSVEAIVGNSKSLDRLAVHDVRLNNLLDIGGGHSPVPDTVRINDHGWAVLALIETTRHIGAHTFFESTQRELLLEEILQLGLSLGIATTARMSGLPLIAADKKVLLELRHLLNLQDFDREIVPQAVWNRASALRNTIKTFSAERSPKFEAAG